jgi:hypothetical protein
MASTITRCAKYGIWRADRADACESGIAATPLGESDVDPNGFYGMARNKLKLVRLIVRNEGQFPRHRQSPTSHEIAHEGQYLVLLSERRLWR